MTIHVKQLGMDELGTFGRPLLVSHNAIHSASSSICATHKAARACADLQ